MAIRILDFLSQPPNNFIFRRDSNKTFIGGLLSIIYFIFAFLVSLIYYIGYRRSLPYEITSYIAQDKVLNDIQKEKFKNSDKYNPTLKFKFTMDFDGKQLSDKFILYDTNQKKIIGRNETIERRVNDLDIYVLYKCKKGGHNCEIEDEDRKSSYNLRVYYQDYYIYPQTNKNAIELYDKDYFAKRTVYFSPEVKLMSSFRWSIVRCKDEGIFQLLKSKNEQKDVEEENIYIGGKLQRYLTRIQTKNTYAPEIPEYRYVFNFIIRSIDYTNVILYEDYVRKEKSFFRILPDIFSYWLTLYNVFSWAFFKFYSKSFDKYKIVENILSREKGFLLKMKKQKQKIKNNDVNLEEILIENDSNNNDTENLNIINDSIINENEDIINDINENRTTFEIYTNGRNLPKRRCIDYICNNFCKSCSNEEKQKIINDCIKLVFKYYSIENVLYNQILFENLIEDYEWKNPKLKNILTNKSFNKILNDLKE